MVKCVFHFLKIPLLVFVEVLPVDILNVKRASHYLRQVMDEQQTF